MLLQQQYHTTHHPLSAFEPFALGCACCVLVLSGGIVTQARNNLCRACSRSTLLFAKQPNLKPSFLLEKVTSSKTYFWRLPSNGLSLLPRQEASARAGAGGAGSQAGQQAATTIDRIALLRALYRLLLCPNSNSSDDFFWINSGLFYEEITKKGRFSFPPPACELVGSLLIAASIASASFFSGSMKFWTLRPKN